MSLHLPVRMDQVSTCSTLLPHSISSPINPSGPRCVPVLPWGHSSKWNVTVNRQTQPFTVAFHTEGVPQGYGIGCSDFALRSAAVMTTMVVDGGNLVHFPNSVKKIQLRIVVSCSFLDPLTGAFPDECVLSSYSGRGTNRLTFQP